MISLFTKLGVFILRVIIFILMMALMAFFNGIFMGFHIFMAFMLGTKYDAIGKIISDWNRSFKFSWSITEGTGESFLKFIVWVVFALVVFSIMSALLFHK